MELVQLNNNTKVTELQLVSKYFNKSHKNLLRDIDKLIGYDSTLRGEFIPTQYTNEQGRVFNTYYLTEEGFCLLAMGFTGAKALEWKRKFYKAFKDLQTENSKLREYVEELTTFKGCTDERLRDVLRYNINTLKNLIGSKLSRPTTSCTDNNKKSIFSIVEDVKELQTENSKLTNYLNTINLTGGTYCITDICCKFKGLLPYQANLYLLERGIIEKRASGYYPSIDCLDWCISATAWNGTDLENYVRYTPKGVEHIYNLLLNDGYEEVK